MAGAIDKLKKLMPPPSTPVNPGSEKERLAFETRIGLRFPKDYFIVIHTYGSGRFLAGEFRVNNPFEPADEDSVEREFKTLREITPDTLPFLVFPEPGGLYPLGIDCNGNGYVWITGGESSEWPIVCYNSEAYYEVVNYSLTEFLVRLATNRLEINRRRFWGNDFAEDLLEFVPRKVTKVVNGSQKANVVVG